MQLFTTLLIVVVMILSLSRAFKLSSRSYSRTALNMGLHDHSLEDLSGSSINLNKYKGSVVLLENVATL